MLGVPLAILNHCLFKVFFRDKAKSPQSVSADVHIRVILGAAKYPQQ